jgi:S-formylglutathione hydrolase FrmB
MTPTAPSRRWPALLAAALVALLLAPLATPPAAAVEEPPARPVAEAPDELDPAEDNGSAASRDACTDVRAESGSLIIRRLVDGPRQADGSLAFTSGVCIYLPPGYEDGTQRYPVLYLLHGGFGAQHDWVSQGDAQAVLDRAVAADPADAMIVVMPDATSSGSWKDDASGFPRNETYVIDHVIPYVDTHLRTIADRSGRAMSGLSNGGAGTLRLAAKHPDLFDVATAMSAALPLNMATDRTDIRALADDPTEIADNLEAVELAIIWGLTCGDAASCQTYGFAYAFEHACCSNVLYEQRLRQVREREHTYVATVGAHDWFFWTAWLDEEHGPFIRARLADPVPVDAEPVRSGAPETFRFRTIEPAFSIYGYDVATDQARAAEFLRLTDVTADGLTVRGSGPVAITTAPRYAPGAVYRVTGLGGLVVELVADADGRLALDVDLGAPHTAAEGSPAALAAEAAAAGTYWTTRVIGIAPAG